MTDMNPLALWIVSIVLGVGNGLLAGLLGVIFGAIFFLLALLLAVRGDRGSVLSGLLIGFGGTWLAPMARQSATGGHLDDPTPWLALGIVSVALGLLVGPVRIARHGRGPMRV